MFAAVAAVSGSYQCSCVLPATVKSHSAGGVIGGAGCDVSVLSRHLHSVESGSTALRPGEVPSVCPTVHMSSQVGWLTRSWKK